MNVLLGRMDSQGSGLEALVSIDRNPPDRGSRAASDFVTHLSRLGDRRMTLVRQWDGLVAQVRRQQGLEDFLARPRLKRLLSAASGGPVIIINVSEPRCDALILTLDGIQVVKLPQLSVELAIKRTNDYLGHLEKTDQATSEYQIARLERNAASVATIQRYYTATVALRAARQSLEKMLRDLLGWLWDSIAHPVLDALGFSCSPGSGQEWPRLWWCPTGPLSLLPLHAAGYHHYHECSNRPTVLDRVISSYTPTLRALTEARNPAEVTDGDRTKSRRMLMVALPQTPGKLELPYVGQERDVLVNSFPSDKLTILEANVATRNNVYEQLGRHRWAHFCCHGDQDLTDPSRGGLLLHDGTLTIQSIASQRYSAEFAFLSACKTATGGVTLPDESITLAAAMHYAGYRHVIAALWSIYDMSAAELAKAVYADLTSSGNFRPERSAHALHMAIRRLRDNYADQLSAWVPFTHTGP